MGYEGGKWVTFDRPGSTENSTHWKGVVEKVQPDGSLLIRDTSRKLRVVRPDARWLTEVSDEAVEGSTSRDRTG